MTTAAATKRSPEENPRELQREIAEQRKIFAIPADSRSGCSCSGPGRKACKERTKRKDKTKEHIIRSEKNTWRPRIILPSESQRQQ
jgi:hypothetical protein